LSGYFFNGRHPPLTYANGFPILQQYVVAHFFINELPVYDMSTMRSDKVFGREVLLKPGQYFGHCDRVSFIVTINAAVITAGLYTNDAACVLPDHSLHDWNNDNFHRFRLATNLQAG
jgi:hypothetical protein